jgi:exosortase/archaeosortase family protein
MSESANSLKVHGYRLGRWTKESPLTCLLLLTVLLTAGAQIVFFTTARDNAIPLWLLAVILAWRAMEQLRPQTHLELPSQIAAWLFVALVPFALQLPSGGELHIGPRIAMLLLAMSIMIYRNGLKAAASLMPILFLTLVIIPVQEQLFLAISYPLRLISTILTVETLQLFGCDIIYQLTTIRVQGFDLAITDACSGISQLAVLFLLGYIVVIMKQHRNFGYAALHYLALLPVVIVANAIRLILTIVLFYAIGEKAFGNAYHAALGYFFVFLATSLFYAIGALFPQAPTVKTSPNSQSKSHRN